MPAIDIKDGDCVRLLRGEFDRQTHYSSDPLSIAAGFQTMGFSHLHVVDLDGAQSGAQKNRKLVREITATNNFEIQLGGGIRDTENLRSWLDTGVSRCVIGSIAVTDATTVKAWLAEFGADNIVLALDVRLDSSGIPSLATHGWTRASDITLWQCVDSYSAAGLRHVLCTDINRDGAMAGPAVDLYREFKRRYPGIQLQASGGVRNVKDLELLRDAGAAAAITGKALLDGAITKEEILSFQRVA